MIYLSHQKGVVYVEKDGLFSKIMLQFPNAPITKKYLLEQIIRLLDNVFSRPQSCRKFVVIDCCKSL